MRNRWIVSALIAATATVGLAYAPAIQAAQKNGAVASNFTLTSSTGKAVSLDAYRGKTVVLEWHNPGCPFVVKHYASGNMQATQRRAREAGVVWLTINSGAEGKQGYLSPAEAVAMAKDQKFNSSHYLFDREGAVGKAYGAVTTPHVYVINAQGELVYQGGIDDKPTANQADIKTARNHVLAALDEVKAGKPVSVANTKPYGCSVKYKG